MSTLRESFFNLISPTFNYTKEEKEILFFNIVKKVLSKRREIKIPMQLFESIFEFDFHRGAKHPIPSNIIKRFTERELKATKVRNYYLVRIRKK